MTGHEAAPERIDGDREQASSGSRNLPLFGGVVAALILVAMYRRAAEELYTNWNLVDSYYTHGYLVPLVSLFFVWKDRARIAGIPVSPSAWGLVWMAFAGVMLLVGDFLGFRVFGHLSILPMLTGALIVFQGRARTQCMWFPIVFLIFMIPIPPSMTQSIALQLKLIAAETAVRIANLLTLPMVREGSYIHFGSDKLLVGDVCGGLRSLISLLALGALAAYISSAKRWGKVLLLVLAGPIAIAANIVRIFFLCVVGYIWGSEMAGGKVHDLSGVLIYAVAIMLFVLAEVPLRRWAGAERENEPKAQETPAAVSRRSPVALFGIALVLLGAVTFTHLKIINAQALANLDASAPVNINIPDRIVDYKQVGVDVGVDTRTQQILESSTIVIRNYASPAGRPIQLSIVHAGTTRRSLHFPEVCLVGAGWEIVKQESASVGILFSAKRLVLVKGDQQEAVLYWFKTGDTVTGNFFLNAFYWAKNQLTFGTPTSAMIKVTTPILSDGEGGAFASLEDFATKFAPVMSKEIQ
ncbi:MAG: EpsI family protein [Candidatus Hydrogenedentes bacterium]|nr:EpsI family protein [Candidatus Hydrogenedentota bacterium]